MGLRLVLLCLLLARTCWAGQAMAIEHAYIGYIYPAGGQMGTSVEASVGGEDIYGATGALVSGKGVTVQVIDSRDPDQATTEERKKFKKKNRSVIDEVVKLRIAIAPDAEPGDRNLCLVTPLGVSNMRIFQVGQLKETLEVEPNSSRDTAMPIAALPATINGQIMPGDTDMFRFNATRGQHLVIEAAARSLIPYIADAVPGWFQALICLYDTKGREVACADDFQFSQDPVLFYDVPADGSYTLAIRDSIYRGRQDFIYRIRIGELPFITGIHPLGAQAGAGHATVAIRGRNLPVDTVSVNLDAPPSTLRQIVVTGRSGILSNRVPFALGGLPEVAAGDTPSCENAPQAVTPPVIINGRIRAPGASDWYRFPGTRGQAIAVEVRARRLGSPLDSYIVLLNSRGEVLAENDDLKDKGEGILTHQADSELMFRLPEDGSYLVKIYDTQGKGGEAFSYRLRIGPYVPDYELRATPAAVHLARNGSAQITVHAIRRDGFSGAIAVAFDEPAPAGLTLDAGTIPAGVDRIRMTITASAKAPLASLIPRLHGTATLEGRPLTRPVVFAEELLQAFIYQHLVPSREQLLMVTDPPAPFTITPHLPAKGWVDLAPGQAATFPISVTRTPGFDGPIKIMLLDPPKDVSMQRGFIPAGRDAGFVTLEVEEAISGRKQDNLIFYGTMYIDPPGGQPEEAKPGAKAAKAAAKAGEVAVAKTDATPLKADGKKSEDKKPVFNKIRVIAGMPAVPIRFSEAANGGKMAAPAKKEQ